MGSVRGHARVVENVANGERNQRHMQTVYNRLCDVKGMFIHGYKAVGTYGTRMVYAQRSAQKFCNTAAIRSHGVACGRDGATDHDVITATLPCFVGRHDARLIVRGGIGETDAGGNGLESIAASGFDQRRF